MTFATTIRFANIDDMKNVFDLSNDDIVRANSIHTEKSKNDHPIKANFALQKI